jgi:serine/threonine-protein kinase
VDHDGDVSLAGRVISGRYRLDELVAAGGMGAVYRGEHLGLKKRVAVKVLLPHAERRQELVARFEREAIAGARVHHPNVVAATDFGKEPDGSRFLVLEYVDGTTLADELERGPLDPAEARRIARQLSAALAAVHEEGIVHRDVKPSNVMLTARGREVKLVDFGFARVPVGALSPALAEAEGRPIQPLTEVGTVVGTMSYMAPEAVEGMSAVEAPADLYGLGLVLYEMLAGQHPFDAAGPIEMFRAQREQPPPPICERTPGVEPPPELEAIAMKLLSKKPGDRYASAAEVALALDAASLAKAPPGSRARGGHTVRMAAPASLGAARSRTEGGTLIMKAPAPRAATSPGVVETLLRRARGAPPALWVGAGVLSLTAALFLVLASRGGRDAPRRASGVDASPDARTMPAASVTPREIEIEVDGLDAPTWKTRLALSVEAEDWNRGAAALAALARIDPSALGEARLRHAAVAVATALAFEGGPTSDRVFDALTRDFGGDGLEVLFEIIRTRGSTKASKRASDILARPEVAPRVPAGMRLALEFRRATCEGKRAMVARAADEGDKRVLDELVILRDRRCERDEDPCCFKTDKDLAAAIKRLRERLAN